MAADCSFLDGFELYNDAVFQRIPFTPSAGVLEEISSLIKVAEGQLSGFTLFFDWREWTASSRDYVNYLTLHCLTSDDKEVTLSLKTATTERLRAEAHQALLARTKEFNPLGGMF